VSPVAAAQTFTTPLSGNFWNNRVVIGGATSKDAANFNSVGPGYFETLGMKLVAGRDFDGRDTPQSPKVAIVTESFARTHFGGRDPLGQAFQIEAGPGEPQPFYQIVGVVRDTKYRDLREPFTPLAHVSALQDPEPGRSLVGNAGITVYEVGTVKEIPGVRTYVAVDGGMSDNMRPMLYGARYDALIANRAADPPETRVTVAGMHCESSDVIVRDALLAAPRVGDILVTPATGAYGHAMASNYNGVTRPPVVFAADGDARLVVRRETHDDLLARDG